MSSEFTDSDSESGFNDILILKVKTINQIKRKQKVDPFSDIIEMLSRSKESQTINLVKFEEHQLREGMSMGQSRQAAML